MKNWVLAIIIGFLVLVIVFDFMSRCSDKTKKTIVYKKGLPKVVHVKGKADTVVTKGQTKWREKTVVKLIRDTVHHFSTVDQKITAKGVTIHIRDTVQGDSIRRMVDIIKVDSTIFITRTDTVKSTRIDTVFVKSRWKDLKIAFGVGYVAGIATTIALKPP
jgi:hypothetical protein